EVEPLLVGVEVERQHGGRPSLETGTVGRRLQQAGAAAPRLAGEDQHRRRTGRREHPLDPGESLGVMLRVEPVFRFWGAPMDVDEPFRHGRQPLHSSPAAGMAGPESGTPMLWEEEGIGQTGPICTLSDPSIFLLIMPAITLEKPKRRRA